MVPRFMPDLPVIVKMRIDWKLLCSFFKRDWAFEDYPVYACPWIAYAIPNPFPWEAYIVLWPSMHAGGNTGPEAIEKLRKKFESFKQENPLPRPGRCQRTKLEFAPTERIVRHQQLKAEFVANILRLPFAFISDKSTLMDFDPEIATPRELAERIRAFYGVDVSDVPGDKVVDIFDHIAAIRAKGQ